MGMRLGRGDEGDVEATLLFRWESALVERGVLGAAKVKGNYYIFGHTETHKYCTYCILTCIGFEVWFTEDKNYNLPCFSGMSLSPGLVEVGMSKLGAIPGKTGC